VKDLPVADLAAFFVRISHTPLLSSYSDLIHPTTI
jgi:hypothetical protein